MSPVRRPAQPLPPHQPAQGSPSLLEALRSYAHVRKQRSAIVKNAVETKGVGVIRRKRTGMSQLRLFVRASPLDSNPLSPKARAFVIAYKADDVRRYSVPRQPLNFAPLSGMGVVQVRWHCFECGSIRRKGCGKKVGERKPYRMSHGMCCIALYLAARHALYSHGIDR